MLNPLNLTEVALCCVDTRLPHMALDAMKTCMSQARFGQALLFTRPGHGLREVPPGIEVIELAHVDSIEAYSHFLLKEMRPYLKTSHMLIVQWDGYVVDPAMWDDGFLDVDYIGAVWPQYKDAHRVGNGGFSLRSARLLDALLSDAIKPHHPEDVCIARTCRAQLEQGWGIRFADEAMAHRFAVERAHVGPSSFGFHGLSNMARLLNEAQLAAFMAQAPAGLFGSTEARGFIKHLIQRKMKPLAREALRRRKQAKPLNLADLRLWARLVM